MSSRSFLLNGDLAEYVGRLAGHPTEVQRRLAEATNALPNANMQSSPEAARVLALLVGLTRARRAVEVGTFTGYGALAIASALPDDGRLVCCDARADWPAIGRPFWEAAGVADRIELRVGPAADTLRQLAPSEYDFAFVDADKAGYPTYYEACLTLLRPGGLMVFDNALRGGRVADPDAPPDAGLAAVRHVNQLAFQDPRVEPSLLLIGDGLLLARKR
ncbi:MAG: class I SAM-dependent methyltransferase [Planctomycetota bacterium]